MGGLHTGRRSATPWFLTVPPERRSSWVTRERLKFALESKLDTHRALLLEAPSGYGKTIALAEWADSRTAPTAWLTLTTSDASPDQLFSGVLTALIRIHPENTALAALLGQHFDGDLSTDAAVLALIEIMLKAGTPTTLIIDDAHLTSREAFASVVLPIVEFGRGQLLCVIAGVRDVRSWCTRALAHGDAAALDPATLAFMPGEVAEAQAHVQAQLPSPAPPGDAQALWEDTQGWPVAVLLALQSGATGSIDPAEHHEAISRYIETVALAGLRPELRDFVLATATCSRVNDDLAGILSARSDAAELLDECRSIGLFLDRFHGETGEVIYRWHSTFAKHCRDIAARNDRDQLRRRHLLAADWFATRFPTQGVFHALEADKPELAVTILEDNWLQMLSGGQAGLLATSCAQIPMPWQNSPSLLLIRACCLDIAGDQAGATRLAEQGRAQLPSADSIPAADRSTRADPLRAADQDRTADPDHTADRAPRQRDLITAAFADLFLLHDQLGVGDAADRAHEYLMSTPLTPGQYLHGRFIIGWTELRLRRDPSRAITLLNAVALGAREAGHPVLANRAAANLSFALAFGGRFAEAQASLDTLSSAAGMAEWEYYDGGIEVVSAIVLAYWRGDLDTAIDLARKLHARGGHQGSYAALARVYFAFAAAKLRSPALYAEAANMLLGVSATEQHGVPWPAYRSIGTAQLAMARGDHRGALAALEVITEWDTIPTTLVMSAELYRQLGQHERAIEMLRGIKRPEMVSYVYASAQLTKAAIAWAMDDHAVAHRALERSVKVAASESIITPFMGLDEVSRELFIHHSSWGTSFEGFVAARLAGSMAGVNRRDVMSTPLSSREQEVFSYLSTTMTAEEIAAALHVSVNTVRSHQRSIYRKLGVSTRREAIRVHL